MIFRGLPCYWCALLLFTATAAAQPSASIQGRVTFKVNGDPVHNATITIVQIGRTAIADREGSFAFRDVPPGRYTVLAHMHPLSDEARTVELRDAAAETLDFRLELAPMHEQITVTASGHEETTHESFRPVDIVPSLELATRASASLGEALERETGVAKRSFGPGTSRPVVRGFDGDRVLIMQDGIATGTLSSQSGDHGEPFDVSNLERVEVVRGPATLLYGTNAAGGVVNVITQHHMVHEHVHAGARGFLTTSAGSANAQGGANGGFDIGLGNWTVTGGGGGLRTGDYATPLGSVQNSHTGILHTTAGIARHGAQGFFNLTYGVYDGRYGIPVNPEAGHDHAAEPAGHAHEEGPVDLKWRRQNLRFSGGVRDLGQTLDRFTLHLNYSDWKHNEMVEEEAHTRFFNRQFSYRGVFDQRKRGPWSGSFGFSGLRRNYDVTGEEAITPPVSQTSFGVFGLEELSFERIRFQFGARGETNRYSPNGLVRRTFTGLSGAAAANVRLWNGGAFVASYSNSYRAPALEELYNAGPHPGNLAFEIGDLNLGRERSQGLDLGLRHAGARFRAEANFFHYRIGNYVFLERTGEIEDGLFVANYRQGDARYQGAEARLDLGLHPNIWLNLGLDSVNAKLRPSGTPLPRIPPVRGRLGFDARRGGLSIRPELVLAGAQERLHQGETRTAGYGALNLTSSYTLVRTHTLHAFSATLYNATDRLYRNHISLIKDFAPEIGRGVRFAYTIRFF